MFCALLEIHSSFSQFLYLILIDSNLLFQLTYVLVMSFGYLSLQILLLFFATFQLVLQFMLKLLIFVNCFYELSIFLFQFFLKLLISFLQSCI